jgi:hypothetical protein
MLQCTRAVFPAVVTWYSTAGLPGRREQRDAAGYVNQAELRLIRRLLNRLATRAAECGEQVGVTIVAGTPEQGRRLEQAIEPDDAARWSHLVPEIATIDVFARQPCEVLIYSVTRSNAGNELAPFDGEDRLHHLWGSARDTLVIVGDHRFCQRARGGENPLAKVLGRIESGDRYRLERVRRT